MQTTVNPHRFVGQEISLSPLARGQSAIMLGGLRIGRVSHAPASGGREGWLWMLSGPYCGSMPPDAAMLGEARTLSDAKQALRNSFDCWLKWALEQDGPVHWHWTEQTPGVTDSAKKAAAEAAHG